MTVETTKHARGARVVVTEDGPEGTKGRTCLVLEDRHEADAEVAVVSFDEVPTLLAVVRHAHLRPIAPRLCVSGEPNCSLLDPCVGCLFVLRAHLNASLTTAGLADEQARRFVETWNRLREAERGRMRETIAQARAWAEKAAQTNPVLEAAAGQAPGETPPTPQPEEKAAPPAEVGQTPAVTHEPPPEPTDIPQVIPTPAKESRSTPRRAPRRNAAPPEPELASPSPAPPPREAVVEGEAGEGTGGESSGGEAVGLPVDTTH